MENSSDSLSVVEIKKKQYIVEILHEIYKSGPNTIAQLAKKLHTSVPSITVFVNELIKEKWLEELGAFKTKSGRRPSLYDINPNKFTILVIDINLHSVNFSLINLRNDILIEEDLQIEIKNESTDEIIVNHAKGFIANKDIWAACVVSPGLINLETGINFTYPNLNFKGKSISQAIEDELQIRTLISHDTMALLVGEHDFGLAINRENALVVNIDWGIGLGILCNGQIIKGAHGYAGELGHIQIKPDGKLCACGKRGCLETVASASALIDNAEEGIKEGKATVLNSKAGNIKIEDIILAALNGDEFSIDLIIAMGNELGKGLSIAIHMFNPEIIVIQGILTKSADLIVSTLNQAINKYCLLEFKRELQVLVSPISKDAKKFGAKSLVFDEMLKAMNY